VLITGAEQVTGWEPADGGVWTVTVPNGLFSAFNPFAEEVDGDWIVYPEDSPRKHLGTCTSTAGALTRSRPQPGCPTRRCVPRVLDDWTGLPDRVRDAEQTRFV
jgi:hypothetical protein